MNKKVMLALFLSVLIITSCSPTPSSESIQTAIALTQTSAPTNVPIPTDTPEPTHTPIPTLTVEQVYCKNFSNANDDLGPFRTSIMEFVAFLQSDSNMEKKIVGQTGNYTWGEWLNVMLLAGPVASSSIRQSGEGDMKKAFDKFVSLSRDIEEKGIKLQMSFNRENPPQSIEMAHQKILECFSDASESVASIANFLENDKVFYELPGFESCSRLDLYYEEISNMCEN